VSKRVRPVRRAPREPHPDEEQDLVAGVGDGVERFGEHRRAAGGSGRGALERGQGRVAEERRRDRRPGFGHVARRRLHALCRALAVTGR
jgi:hypothetical protein